MYEIDPAAVAVPRQRYDGRMPTTDNRDNDDDGDDVDVDGLLVTTDGGGVALPPSLRRIFWSGGLAFLLLVLLAASTLSQVVVPAPPPVGTGSSSFINNKNHSEATTATSTSLRQRDEEEQGGSSSSLSFAESILNLMQETVDELVQAIQQSENSNGGSGEGSNNSTSSGSGSPPPPSAAPVAEAPVPSPTAPPSGATASASSPTTSPDANGIITEGTVNGIAYYGCRYTSNVEKTILLFHGASFSKEQWKTSGILSSLCSQATLTVYAFDMPVSSTANELQALMDALHQSRLIMSLPVNAIVTPSASGYMVVNWGQQVVSNTSSLPAMSNYWKLWVPVASPAVAYVDPKSLLSSMFPNINILAVHGDQDTSGGRVMQLLGTYAGAQVVTISGGHACYMQSPDDFVTAVLGALQ